MNLFNLRGYYLRKNQKSNALQAQTTGTGNAFSAISKIQGKGRAGLFEIQNSSSTSTALEVSNAGTGITGLFYNTNSTSPSNITLAAVTTSSGGPTFAAYNFGTSSSSSAGLFNTPNSNNNANTFRVNTDGIGRTAIITNNNTANTNPVLEVSGKGTGIVLSAWTNGIQGANKSVANFSSFNPLNASFDPNSVVRVSTNSNLGNGIVSEHTGAGGAAGMFINNNSSNISAALYAIKNYSGGAAFVAANNNFTSPSTAIYASTPANTAPPTLLVQKATGIAGHFIGKVFVDGDVEVVKNVQVMGDVQAKGYVFVDKDISAHQNVYVAEDINITKNAHVSKDLTVFGLKSAVVTNAQGQEKLTYSVESPEVWFEDFGGGKLVTGTGTVNIEPEFLSTVNTATEKYRVYIQLEGQCPGGVYVTEKTVSSFKIKQNSNVQGQGQGSSVLCNAEFSYRIIAKRKGFESLRMPTFEQDNNVITQTIDTSFIQEFVVAQEAANKVISEINNFIPYLGTTIDSVPQIPSVENILQNISANQGNDNGGEITDSLFIFHPNQSIDVVAPVDTTNFKLPVFKLDTIHP